jgi:hypothetical protein
MLKNLLISSLVAAGLSASWQAEAGIEEALANICAIVEANDKGELRKKMKNVRSDYQMQLRDYYSGITCGGNSLIRVAMLNNATDVGTLLVKKMPKKHLTQPENDGKTLQAWITEQGLQDHDVAKELQDRI